MAAIDAAQQPEIPRPGGRAEIRGVEFFKRVSVAKAMRPGLRYVPLDNAADVGCVDPLSGSPLPHPIPTDNVAEHINAGGGVEIPGLPIDVTNAMGSRPSMHNRQVRHET